MKQYLLSDGSSTRKIEKYIIDLFRLNLHILPNDIPGSDIGFNLIITDTKKDEMVLELRSRLEVLLKQVSKRFGDSFQGDIDGIEIISNNNIKVTINISGYTEEVAVNL